MTTDFEVHLRGTTEELRLSRELAQQIEQITHQFGDGIVPNNVFQAYKKLTDYYQVQRETYEW